MNFTLFYFLNSYKLTLRCAVPQRRDILLTVKLLQLLISGLYIGFITTAGHWTYPKDLITGRFLNVRCFCSKQPIWHTDSQGAANTEAGQFERSGV